jgi:hypothetical protein
MPTPLINGVGYSWAQITIKIGGVAVSGVQAITYGDKQDISDVYGAGPYPVERVEGKITSSCSMTMLMSEVEALQQSVPSGRLQDIGEFDIVVSFEPGNGIVRTHKILNCRFLDNTRKMKSSDQTIPIDMTLICSQIIWNA